MTIVVMQASRIGIRTVLTSMILKPFLYVVAVVSAAQTAGNGVDWKECYGSGAHFPSFFHFFQKSASTFHVERRRVLRRKQNCVIERRIPGFTHLGEAGEFS